MRASSLLGLALFAASAGAGPTATTARTNCGAKRLTLYFWPQGHPAIPSIGFEEFKTPHLEVYTSGGKQIGYVDSTGVSSFAKGCKHAAELPLHWDGKKQKSIAQTMLVKCSLPAAAEMKGSKAHGGGALTIAAGHTTKEVVSVSMGAGGSKLTYDTRYCKTSAAPKPPQPSSYSFSGLTLAFDGQFVAGGPSTHITYTVSGTMCGDPSTSLWTVTLTPNIIAPSNASVVLKPGVSTQVGGLILGQPEVSRILLSLTFATPPPTMTLTTTQTGGISNVQVGPPVPVTVTPVASCP